MLRTNSFETKRTRRAKKALAFGLAMTFALLVLIALQAATKPAHAATTFTVNSTGDGNDLDFPGGTFDGSSDGRCDVDSGTTGDQCTLRAAIQQANKSRGADAINFAILGTGPHTISPATNLPTITKPLTIDGYTQSGATPNTLTQPGKTDAVLKIELGGTSGASIGLGFGIGASKSVIRGLAINNFGGQGIFFLGGEGYKVEGNFIGTDPSGTVDKGNGFGGVIFSGTDGSTIGGTSPEARNLISGNDLSGVWLQNGSSANKIQGNLIGTKANGTEALGNTRGVTLTFSAGNGNRILSNAIFSNTGLGIDLGGDGVTANDDKDPDTGPNRLQNYPLITSAFTQFNQTTIGGELNSTPSTRKKKRTFIIQFFSSPAADPSGFGEGQTFLGQTVVKTNREGNASFGFAPAQKVSEGQFITATATNKARGDTSDTESA